MSQMLSTREWPERNSSNISGRGWGRERMRTRFNFCTLTKLLASVQFLTKAENNFLH